MTRRTTRSRALLEPRRRTNTVIFGKNTTEAINKLAFRYPLARRSVVLSTGDGAPLERFALARPRNGGSSHGHR